VRSAFLVPLIDSLRNAIYLISFRGQKIGFDRPFVDAPYVDAGIVWLHVCLAACLCGCMFVWLPIFSECKDSKGKMSMAKKSGGPNKSAAIRDFFQNNPSAMPREAVEALKAQGISVTPAFVSTIKTKLSGGKKRGRGRKKAVAAVTEKGRRGRPAGKSVATRSSSDSIYQHLIIAKQMADKMGGIEKARAALEALAKITG